MVRGRFDATAKESESHSGDRHARTAQDGFWFFDDPAERILRAISPYGPLQPRFDKT
jgi:hypothetical protein